MTQGGVSASREVTISPRASPGTQGSGSVSQEFKRWGSSFTAALSPMTEDSGSTSGDDSGTKRKQLEIYPLTQAKRVKKADDGGKRLAHKIYLKNQIKHAHNAVSHLTQNNKEYLVILRDLEVSYQFCIPLLRY